jgi:hypothetical protein
MRVKNAGIETPSRKTYPTIFAARQPCKLSNVFAALTASRNELTL